MRAVGERVHDARDARVDVLPLREGRGRAGRRRGRWRADAAGSSSSRRRPRTRPSRCAARPPSPRRARSRPRAIWRSDGARGAAAPRRARWAGRTGRARCGEARARAPPRRPARWPRCRGTGSRRRETRRPGSRCRAASASVMRPCAKRAPIVCALPASSPSLAGRVTPPGTITAGRSRQAARAMVMAGRPLSQVATPMTALRVGSERIEPPQDDGGVVAIGEAVDHAGRPLRAAVAGIGAEGGERDAAERADLLRRRLHEEADLPVPGVIAEGERRAVRVAHAAERAQDEHLRAGAGRRVSSPCRRSATSRRRRRWDGRRDRPA